jgi:serine/threonine-protein kinase
VKPPDNATVDEWDEDLPVPLRTLRPPEHEGPVTEPATEAGEVDLGALLGEGGMGLVHRAEQRALHREVAVKRARTPALRAQLVQEALVTGALAHPNIVPVYDLRRDDGEPMLLMKRLEGRSWALHLDEGAPLEGRRDPLGWHAGVLLQVCNAVAFAHARGVLHRDLKPHNVMIGEFGEVCVLDWGLALALPGCTLPALPRAAEASGIAGTPAYMSPEQARGKPLDARTDVWLLGAILFELVHHRRVNRTANGSSADGSLRELLAVASAGRVDHPPAPTPELHEVLHRALAPEPDDRYPTVEGFRQALAWAVERRAARSLLDEAHAHLVALRAATDAQEVVVRVAGARAAARRVLAAWPGDAEAEQAWREATDHAVEWHLAHREPAAAELLLVDDPGAPPGVRDRVARAREELDASAQRLRHAEDVSTGALTRGFVITIVGLFWVLVPLAGWWLPITPRTSAAATLGFLTVGAALAVWARDSLSKSSYNRLIQTVVVGAPLVQLVAQVGGWGGGWSAQQTVAASMLAYVGMSAAAVLSLGRRIVPSLVVFTLAWWVAAAWPAATGPAIAAANAVFVGTVFRESGVEMREGLGELLQELRQRLRR